MKRFITIPLLLLAILSKAQWSELGDEGVPTSNGGAISTLCTDASGNIYAAGGLTQALGYQYVAEFNGTSWIQLGSGYTNSLTATGTIESICVDKSGNVYAGGFFKNSSGNYYVAVWNGTTWAELGGTNALAANNEIFTLCADTSGNIYTAGFFTNSSGNAYVAKWTKSTNTWSELGGANSLAANSNIACVYADSLNNIYAAGAFSDGTTGNYVAKYDGSSWSELGTGSNALAANNNILALVTDGAGNVYAAGGFTNSTPYSYVAKWDGTSWTELGGTNALAANGEITTICKDRYGNLYVGGLFKNSSNNWYVAEWNGTSWSELGGANSLAANLWIFSVISDPAGNVYAAGRFTNSSGQAYVAKYGNASLPVQLLSFNIIKENNQSNLLQWTTTQEINSNYFEVERSIDGINFTAIGTVTAKGNSNTKSNYSFTDKMLSTEDFQSPVIYYRLKIMNKDGSFNYSSIKTISNKISFEVSVYPNPASDNININVTNMQNETAQIEIIGNDGKILLLKKVNLTAGTSAQNINITSLSSGTYFVKIETTEGESTEKFLKIY